MKKIISIVLALTMIFGVFSCNAFAADTLTESALERLNNSDEFHISILSRNGDSENKIVINKKGDKYSLDTTMPLVEGIDIPVRLVFDSDSIVMYFPNFPFFCIDLYTDEVVSTIFELETTDISDMTLTESYEETINGETYNIEIFEDTDGTLYKYALYNGNIVKAECIPTDGIIINSITYVDISTKADLFAFFIPLISIKINDLVGNDFIIFD